MKEFSIVIPAYNEADKIVPSLTQVVTFMRNFSKNFEIIIVDDGSDDNTVDLIENYALDHSEISVIKNPHKGKGPTVWTGVMKAKGKYIYMADADLSTPIDELKKMFNWMSEHDFDIVIASREGIGAVRKNEPVYRHILGRVFNLLVRIVALPGISDSQCGFKLFSNKAAKDIFKRLRIYGEEAGTTKSGYMGAFDVEVLYLARKLGYKVKEVSVPWTYVKTTRLNPIVDSFRMAIDVIRVRLNDIKGLYKE
ncbi:dolichyl-phosphate beta-glucosyltransferase [Patescibacteria group bacterium]